VIRVAHIATVDLTLRYMLIAQLRRLRDEGFDVTAISAPGPHVDELAAEGIRHVPWHNATRSWSPSSDVLAAAELFRILRGERFDVVHTHNPKPGVIGRIVARAAGVPVVVNTVHGFYATPEDRARRRLPVMAMERLAARFSDLELYQSAEDLEWARRAGIAREGRRSRHLGNGTDLVRFDPAAIPAERQETLRSALGIPRDALVVGTIGRLVAEKGYGELTRAAELVRAERPETRFIWVGPADPDKADAISTGSVDHVADGIICTGFRTDVEEMLALMDVFVLASWREGMSRSAIEAGAMGRARILTDIRGCREVVSDGEDGLLVPVRDPSALARAILRLLDDPQERKRLGRRARETAAERFDERTIADVVVESYRELLAGRGLVGRRSEDDLLQGIVIRRARPSDVATIVELHRQDLSTAFHTLLGDRFLRQLFLAQVGDPGCVSLVGERDGDVVGYASAMVSMRAFRRRFLLRHGLVAGFAAAPKLVRPSVVRKVLETLTYPEQTRGLPDAEMAFIGVRRGIPPGLGSELCRGLLSGLADQGVREAKGFVGRENRAMNFMVRGLGFVRRGEVTLHDGSPNYVYTVACSSSSPSR
jgi:glycosyltransferase involved in cell wall biosynthesis